MTAPRAAYRSLVLVALAILALTALPPAAAQTEAVVDPPVALAVTVTPHGQPIRPNLDLGSATANVTVTCTSPGVYSKPVEVLHNAGANSAYGTAIPVEPVRTLTFAPEECVAGAVAKSYDVVIDLAFGTQAAAFEDVIFTFTAVANQTTMQAEWTEKVGFGGGMSAEVEDSFREENGTVQIRGRVLNDANAAITAKVEVADAPSGGSVEPRSRTLEVPPRDLRSGEAEFTFDYVPTSRELDRFTLRVTAAAKNDPSAILDPVDVEVLLDPLQNTAFGPPPKESPVPVLPAFVAAALLLVALRRRG